MVHQEAPLRRGAKDGPLVKRSRHRPLTPVTRVRFPHGSPKGWILAERLGSDIYAKRWKAAKHLTGAYDDEVPPVPIPNTEVKLIRAEDTWRETAWKNRSVPVQKGEHNGCSPFLFLQSGLKKANRFSLRCEDAALLEYHVRFLSVEIWHMTCQGGQIAYNTKVKSGAFSDGTGLILLFFLCRKCEWNLRLQ